MLGNRKGEIAKDTFYSAQYKMIGNGLEGSINIASKGKTIMQGKAVIGYDKRIDKLIEPDLLFDSSDMQDYGI